MKDDVFETYLGLDKSAHTEGVQVDGREICLLHREFGRISVLAAIERLVDACTVVQGTAFEVRASRFASQRLTPNRLGRYYSDAQTALRGFQPSWTYSVKVQQFFDACHAVGLRPGSEHGLLTEPSSRHEASGRFNYDLFNALVEHLRSACQGSRYQARLKRQQRNRRRREARVLLWEQQLFEWRSRHQILLLCLGYHPDIRLSVPHERIQSDLNRLLNNRRSNQLLSGIDGYVAKLEEGDKTGLHVHILLAYAPVTRNDIGIAKRIGQYWQEVITHGEGTYWNSNLDKRRHALNGHGVGTGLIDQFETAKREALRSNLRYLAKSDQHLKLKQSAKTKVIWISQVPEKVVTGRPRIVRCVGEAPRSDERLGQALVPSRPQRSMSDFIRPRPA
jgi:hypothetical protein